ncbi:MAG: hypothetical protein ACI86H_000896, partial [bacterium]
MKLRIQFFLKWSVISLSSLSFVSILIASGVLYWGHQQLKNELVISGVHIHIDKITYHQYYPITQITLQGIRVQYQKQIYFSPLLKLTLFNNQLTAKTHQFTMQLPAFEGGQLKFQQVHLSTKFRELIQNPEKIQIHGTSGKLSLNAWKYFFVGKQVKVKFSTVKKIEYQVQAKELTAKNKTLFAKLKKVQSSVSQKDFDQWDHVKIKAGSGQIQYLEKKETWKIDLKKILATLQQKKGTKAKIQIQHSKIHSRSHVDKTQNIIELNQTTLLLDQEKHSLWDQISVESKTGKVQFLDTFDQYLFSFNQVKLKQNHIFKDKKTIRMPFILEGQKLAFKHQSKHQTTASKIQDFQFQYGFQMSSKGKPNFISFLDDLTDYNLKNYYHNLRKRNFSSEQLKIKIKDAKFHHNDFDLELQSSNFFFHPFELKNQSTIHLNLKLDSLKLRLFQKNIFQLKKFTAKNQLLHQYSDFYPVLQTLFLDPQSKERIQLNKTNPIRQYLRKLKLHSTLEIDDFDSNYSDLFFQQIIDNKKALQKVKKIQNPAIFHLKLKKSLIEFKKDRHYQWDQILLNFKKGKLERTQAKEKLNIQFTDFYFLQEQKRQKKQFFIPFLLTAKSLNIHSTQKKYKLNTGFKHLHFNYNFEFLNHKNASLLNLYNQAMNADNALAIVQQLKQQNFRSGLLSFRIHQLYFTDPKTKITLGKTALSTAPFIIDRGFLNMDFQFSKLSIFENQHLIKIQKGLWQGASLHQFKKVYTLANQFSSLKTSNRFSLNNVRNLLIYFLTDLRTTTKIAFHRFSIQESKKQTTTFTQRSNNFIFLKKLELDFAKKQSSHWEKIDLILSGGTVKFKKNQSNYFLSFQKIQLSQDDVPIATDRFEFPLSIHLKNIQFSSKIKSSFTAFRLQELNFQYRFGINLDFKKFLFYELATIFQKPPHLLHPELKKRNFKSHLLQFEIKQGNFIHNNIWFNIQQTKLIFQPFGIDKQPFDLQIQLKKITGAIGQNQV